MKRFLTFVVILFIAAVAGGFYLGLDIIKKYAIDVNHTVIDANASNDKADTLRTLKQYLADSESLVNKANQLFSTESTYQSQALNDLQKYASATGVSIANTNFDQATEGEPAAARHTVTLTLQSPVSYDNLIRFLDAIEGNLPKMQVSGISISRPNDGSPQQVDVADVTIEISTR